MDKHEVAHILEEIGVLLALRGENPFKVRAYHNAARKIENVTEDLKVLVKEHRIEEIPGIGEGIGQKIATLVTKHRLPYYEKLKKSVPKGILELLKIPGLGEKKVKILYEKLHIKKLEDLATACRKGKVAKLFGFGAKTQASLLNGIAKLKTYGRRVLWWEAKILAEPILGALKKLRQVKNVEIAGSFRRKLETVGDLDFLVASSSSESVMHWFTTQPWVKSILSKGPLKSSVRLSQGIQLDLRIVPEEQFAFALLYFTGSKEHNIKMRQLANKLGFSLSEYGLEPIRKTHPLPLPKHSSKKPLTEEAIFKAFGMSFIPPELREDRGEIDAAKRHRIPALVDEKEIRGAFHCHTTDSDGHNTLEEMAAAAQALGWEYLGLADHSKSSAQAHGMDEERLFNQVARIRKLNKAKKFSTHLFTGVECDILANGKLDFPDRVLKELDYVIVSIHRSFKLEEKAMTTRLIKAIENPYTTIVGHVTGRLLLKREAYAVNLPKVIDACIANHKIIELNAHPMRLDMDWRLWRNASEKGLQCTINPDAHSTEDLQYCLAGINIARKGWLQKKDVLNTFPLAKVQAYLKKR